MNLRPVFIGGCDRSGSTLLGDMLGSINLTFVTPESHFFHDLIQRLKLNSFDSPRDAAIWLMNHFRFASWDLNINIDELSQLIDMKKPRETIESILEIYLKHKHPNKHSSDVWIDHTPDNFKYHSTLKTMFPEARFIHIVRDGRAVSESLKKLQWGPNNAYSASRHWAERLDQALNVEASEGENCFRVHYEQLLAEPVRVLKELCVFIGIPFDAKMINGGGLHLPSFIREQHRLVDKTPQKENADAWRSKMTSADLRDFESYPFSQLLLEKMGYELTFSEMPRLSQLRILNRYLHEYYHYMVNRMRHRIMENSILSSYQKQKMKHDIDMINSIVNKDNDYNSSCGQ